MVVKDHAANERLHFIDVWQIVDIDNFDRNRQRTLGQFQHDLSLPVFEGAVEPGAQCLQEDATKADIFGDTGKAVAAQSQKTLEIELVPSIHSLVDIASMNVHFYD